MRKINFILLLSLAVFLFSCQKDDVSTIDNSSNVSDPSLINKSASADGVSYTMKNVAVNPLLKVLNETNSNLLLSEGSKYEIEILASDITILANDIVYLQEGETPTLLKVVSVSSVANVYTLETENASLGDLFKSGSLEISVDVDKSEKVLKTRNSLLKSSSLENGFTVDILNAVQPFAAKNFVANPNTTVKALYNLKIGFGSGLLPNEVVVTYELHTAMNPYFTSTSSFTGEHAFDFIDNVPAGLLDQLKTIDISVNIPLGDLGTLPAKVGIDNISFPAVIKANASSEFDVRYNANGVFKVGYAYYNNVAGKTSGPIYENTMLASATPDVKLNGELMTDAKVVIVPRITLVNNNLLKVAGTISFGINSYTSGGVNALTNEYVGGSTGTFNSAATLTASSFGITLFSKDIAKDSKELWNVGTFNKTFEISNVKLIRPSKTPCALRSYGFPITFDYKYPILGKKISDWVEVSYDVYDDTKRLLAANQISTVQASSITDKNFTINVCVPFRVYAWGFTTGFTRTTGSIRNLKVTDSMGNVAEYASEIALASPYNNSFWR